MTNGSLRYLTTFQNMAEPVYVVDQQMRLVEVNPAFENFFGCSAREVKGKKCTAVIGAPICGSCPLEKAIREKSSFSNIKFVLPLKGEHKTLVFSGSFLDDISGKYAGGVAILQDVTELELAEEALCESEARYKAIFANTRFGVAVYETANDGQDFIFVDFNKAGEGIDNVKKEDLIGKSVLKMFPGIKDFGLFEVFQRVWKTGKPEHHPVGIYKDERLTGWRENFVYRLPSGEIVAVYSDETKRKLAEQRQHLATRILVSLNQSGQRIDNVRDILSMIKETFGFEAVGIRLREGEDFPYYKTSGFPPHFVEAEKYLCARGPVGTLIRDSAGNPILECMCGNVICGRTCSALPFFNKGGSFWTNSTTDLLASTTEEDRQAHTRNQCNAQGYESVALIPLRSGDEIVGLLQLNDSRKGMFTREMIKFFEGIGAGIGIALKRRQAAETLENRTHALNERVKKLNCLYGMSKLLEVPDISLQKILQEVVDLIPPSWQYPEITCARIILEGQTFQTKNFKDCIWKQTSEIIVNGDRLGNLEVCYLEEKPVFDEGPFLKEERHLINAVSERLGKIIARLRAEKMLRDSEHRYRILTEQVTDGVTLVQEGRFLFANRAFVSMFGCTAADRLVGREINDFVSGDFYRGLKEIYGSLDFDKPLESVLGAQCFTKDGRKFWVEARHNLIEWEGRPSVLTTLRDVTASKLREIAAQRKAEQLQKENIILKSSLKDGSRFGDMIGKSPAMQTVYKAILKAAAFDFNVVIQGESGTGKELIARNIHAMSERDAGKFVPVNCGAFPESLFESEFFGYRKGAFTGAHADKHGFFDLAHGGTLFLDEVADLPLQMQVKLLRAIDGGEYIPLGNNKAAKADVRIVAATHKNLAEMVNRGLFREDFFYRLHVIPITVPALRDRKEDITLLVDHFMRLYGNGQNRQTISAEIFKTLYNHDWPGNVRELENVLKRYLATQHLDFISNYSLQAVDSGGVSGKRFHPESQGLRETLEAFEKNFICEVLHHNRWHRAQTAKDLGIPERTLYRKLKQFRLTSA